MEGYRKSAHATYRCEYHFVWVPKYRYRVLLKDVKKRLNVYKKGTQVLKQLDIGWPFFEEAANVENTLKCFRIYIASIILLGQSR
jgi:hypothetical protein